MGGEGLGECLARCLDEFAGADDDRVYEVAVAAQESFGFGDGEVTGRLHEEKLVVDFGFAGEDDIADFVDILAVYFKRDAAFHGFG